MPRSANKPVVAHKHTTSVPATFPATFPVSRPSSLLQTVKDGFGFGVGSAIAHRMVSAVAGPQVRAEPQSVSPEIDQRNLAYEQCLVENPNDVIVCKYLLELRAKQ